MSPQQPGDPEKGRPEVGKTEADAAEAKEQLGQEAAAGAAGDAAPAEVVTGGPPEEPGPGAEGAGPSPADGTAAAETGVDKDAARAGKATRPGGGPEPAVARARRGPRDRRGGAAPGPAAPVVRAQARYVRTSARKARLVCDHIRGKSVDDARAILAMAPRAVARDWAKLLESAVANAEHNHELVGDDLRVKDVFADEGPTIKRYRPRAMGRATKIRKRTSHLTITLTPKE